MKFSVKMIVMLLIVMVALSGCIKMKRIINVNKDGSGTIEELFVMRDMGFGQSKPFNEEEVKAAAVGFGEGVSYESSEKFTVDDMTGYKAVYKFDDINKVRLPENLVDGIFDLPSEDANEDFIEFSFKKGKTSTLEIKFPIVSDDDEDMIDGEEDLIDGEEDASSNSEEEAQMKEMMKQMYTGMEMKFAVNVNGKITSSDASYTEDNEVILMDMVFDEILKDEGVLDKITMGEDQDEESFMKIMKEIPGMKFEVKKNLTVKFK